MIPQWYVARLQSLVESSVSVALIEAYIYFAEKRITEVLSITERQSE